MFASFILPLIGNVTSGAEVGRLPWRRYEPDKSVIYDFGISVDVSEEFC